MQRRKVQPRRRQSKLMTLFMLVIVIIVMAVCGARALSLHEKSQELAVTENQLQAELDTANQTTVDLQEKEKYIHTKKYIEDEAKNKLGLVKPDEIVIKPKEKED